MNDMVEGIIQATAIMQNATFTKNINDIFPILFSPIFQKNGFLFFEFIIIYFLN